MKKLHTTVVILLSSFLLGACSNVSTSGDASNSSSINGGNSSTSNNDGDISFLNKSYKVEMQGEKWNASLAKCSQFFESSSTQYSDKVELLKNYLNDNDGDDSKLISSLDGSFVYNGSYKESGEVKALQLGSSSSMGEFTINFSRPIFKIEVQVEGYSKPYYDVKNSVMVANADLYSILAIGTSDNSKMKVLDMSVNNSLNTSLPVTLKGEVNFSTGVNSITFKGIGDESFTSGSFASGRIMFHYINFFY